MFVSPEPSQAPSPGPPWTATAFPSPPDRLGEEWCESAKYLSLCLQARGPAALALVEDLAGRVSRWEQGYRKNERRAGGTKALHRAIGGVAGGVLEAWDRADGARASWRSGQTKKFTGAAVGRRLFATVTDALLALGLLARRRGYHPPAEASFVATEEPTGRSARYWPTPALLELALSHGLRPGRVAGEFAYVPPPVVPRLGGPVVLRRLRDRVLSRGPARIRMVADLRDPEAATMAEEVEAQNLLADRIGVSGYPKLRWSRLFLSAWPLHGRWYGGTGDGAYWNMPAARRAELLIGGQPVVELDASASHLTIVEGRARMAGWGARCPMAASPGEGKADRYERLGYPRAVGKQWVVQLLGQGRPPRSWSASAPPEVRAHRPTQVRDTVLRQHPYLRDPTWILPDGLAEKVGAPPEHLVAHHVAALEAEAITLAMRSLREEGILALPVHDSLIVPREAEALTRRAMARGYEQVCGLSPEIRCKVAALSSR
ncbi:hypothetical protein [Muricoccus radiodurans]|uniref:hypothetical protein n=1 Tax=Muricoccus radiodurans TaxID=2231721 RepID=UPI003CF8F902